MDIKNSSGNNAAELIEDKLSSNENKEIQKEFKCRFCRTLLFNETNIKHPLIENRDCSSYFVDGLDWIKKFDENESKITCPNSKCKAKIGKITLSGKKCSCGEWIAPSLQLNKSHVDGARINLIKQA